MLRGAVMPYSILVVGDDEGLLCSLRECLSDSEYLVETAPSGTEALGKIKQKHYDLVITDIGLRDVRGVDILKELSVKHKRTRSIAINGQSCQENLQECMNLDCFGYVDRAFDSEYMKQLVRVALGGNN